MVRGRFASEPKWVDLRSYRGGVRRRDRGFKELNADFAAAIHGLPKEDLLSQEVRQQRRALTLAWSAAASLLVLAGAAGWQWKEAAAQRDRAEAALVQANRNFDAATNVGSGVVEIVRNLISSGAISTKVAEPLLDVTRKTIQQLDGETPNAKLSSLQWRLLNALSFAYVNVPGQGENAVELARRMLALSQELVAAAPDNDDVLQLLINSEIRVGDTLEARGVLDEGLQHLLRARETWSSSSTRTRRTATACACWCICSSGSATCCARRTTRRRRCANTRAISRSRSRSPASRRPSPIGCVRVRWRISGWATFCAMAATTRGALEHFRAYRDLMESLVKTELPNAPNWTWRLDLWIGHQRIGDILFAQKDYAGALAEYEFYNKRAGEAARLDADNGEWQRFLANSHMLIGDVLLAQNSAARALAQYTTAVVIYRDVAKDFRPRSLRNLALGHYRMGMARLAMGMSARRKPSSTLAWRSRSTKPRSTRRS